MKTNDDLVLLAKKALSESWGYCLGEYGEVLTESLLSAKCAQYAYNTQNKTYLQKFMGKRVSDCYGLVKACLWTDDKGTVKYSAVQDRNQEMAFTAAAEKGLLSSMPDIPGLVLWMSGHAGIYIGGGEFVECCGAPTGMRKGTIKNGAITSGNKFTHWFKDTNIQYSVAVNYPLTGDSLMKRLTQSVQIDAGYWNPIFNSKAAAVAVNPEYLRIMVDRTLKTCGK